MQSALRPADAVRRELWRLSAKTRLGRACLADRSLRLAVLAGAHIAVAFALASVIPLWVLLVGPLVLGVPHVASDVRYLLVRPPVAVGRAPVVFVLTALVGMMGFRVAYALGGPYLPEAEVALGGLAIAGGAVLTAGPRVVRGALVVAVVALTALGVAHAGDAALVVGHLHNLVAFGLWVVLAARAGRLAHVIPVIALYALASALILAGALDGPMLAGYATPAAGLDADGLVWSLAPGLEPVPALRLVTLFAFAQSIHYVVWLRLVPQGLAEREAPPTLQRSARDLRRDFGRVGLVALVLVSVAVPLGALATSATDVRRLYLLMVLFHGWLELALIGCMLVRWRAGAGGGVAARAR
ncbi:MAG: hypothetical protein KC635_06625 [Myxococcales bacterium]|nr:hypothetical protein [Myxococcales bacterium]MCB9736730.1 hypothetical protein [Deltaproteobacteria bacterium]